MTTATHPGLPGTLPSMGLRPRRRRLALPKAQQESSPEPSWRTVAPILLFLVGMALMRLGAAEVGAAGAPEVTEMAGD